MSLRYGTLCSGIEAPSVAWEPLDWRPVFFSEIEPFPCAVLAHRYGHVPNLGDMTSPGFSALAKNCGPVDVLCAGTPCQSFSVAGLRGSLSDDRGNLTLQFARIADELDPEWIVWENVPGVLSTKDNAFGCLLAALVADAKPLVSGSPDGKWPVAGVVAGPRRAAAWRVLDAQYFGLAQRRRRVLLVACRSGNPSDPASILLEPESLPRHSPPLRETRPQIARNLTGSTGGCSAKEQQYTFVGGDGRPLNALAPCLRSNPYNNSDAGMEAQMLVMATHQARAEVTDDGTVPTLLACEGPILAHTLRGEGFDGAEDGTGRGIPLVPMAFAQNERDEIRLVGGDGMMAGSLSAQPGMKQQTLAHRGANAGSHHQGDPWHDGRNLHSSDRCRHREARNRNWQDLQTMVKCLRRGGTAVARPAWAKPEESPFAGLDSRQPRRVSI
jgi:DNA (cytosine-5)-methyltransferase 1